MSDQETPCSVSVTDFASSGGSAAPEDADNDKCGEQPRRRSVSESNQLQDAVVAGGSGDGLTPKERSLTLPGDLAELKVPAREESGSLICLDDGDPGVTSDDQQADKNAISVSPIPLTSSGDFSSSVRTSSTTALGCEMCSNYETQLQRLQETERSLKQQLSVAQTLSDRYHTELSGERLMRTEVEAKMTELAQKADDRVAALGDTLKSLEQALNDAQTSNTIQMKHVAAEVRTATDATRNAEQLLQNIEHKYLRLLGAHRSTAAAMQQEVIDLPQSIDELQLHCLTLREELIEVKAAKEHLQESLQSEVAVLQEQVTECESEREQIEANMAEEVNQLRTELAIARSHVNDARQLEDANRQVAEYQTTINDLETKLCSLQREKGELEFELKESQKHLKTLRREMETGEAVQRDFVKLSQSLQIELEKIRQAEQELRWQFDEDVYACNGCQSAFVRAQQKLHCRHCGKIFCDDCLPKTVHAGPQHRPARVCQICHTLLCRDKRPYFSESVPNHHTNVDT